MERWRDGETEMDLTVIHSDRENDPYEGSEVGMPMIFLRGEYVETK